MTLMITLTVLAGVVLGLASVAVLSYRKVGPNQVLVVSGRKGRYVDPATGAESEKNFRIFHGGGTLVLPLIERADVMSVELMTLEIRTPEFFTKFGVPIVVDAIAQIKVRSDDPIAVATAAEMFLSKNEKEMNEIAHQMMQGHLRAVISTLPFEEIHANPEMFSQHVQRLTAADLDNMGIDVVSFTIREVKDPSGFLQAIGRPQLAEVKKEAELGEANASRDAKIGRAAAERAANLTAVDATRDAQMAEVDAGLALTERKSARDRREHELHAEVAASRAQAELAFSLETAKRRRELVERALEVQELEVRLKEQELRREVDEPARAARRRVEAEAAAQASKRVAEAQAEAEAARLMGEARANATRCEALAEADGVRAKLAAEAEGTKARLSAEAEGMRLKAEAWEHYGQAALGELMIAQLPALAAAVTAPLAQVEKIVLVGNGQGGAGVERLTRGITDVITQIPALAGALTGVDLPALLASVKAPVREETVDATESATLVSDAEVVEDAVAHVA